MADFTTTSDGPRPGSGWILAGVVWPLLVTRLILLAVAWFSPYFEPGHDHLPEVCAERGWVRTPIRALDVWARWDSGAYLEIIQDGYAPKSGAEAPPRKIAFFPAFPCLVKGVSAILPGPPTIERWLLVGIVLSNLALVGALLLLYHLSCWALGSSAAAVRTNWLLLLGPGGFYFSAFMTESLFLLATVAALLAAVRGRWALACLLGCAASAVRSPGALVAVPILLLYLRSVEWRLAAIRWSILWLAVVPLGAVAYFGHIYTLYGDPLAPLTVQAQWGRGFAWPWETLIDPANAPNRLTGLERLTTLGTAGLAVIALLRRRCFALGVFALLLLALPLHSGALNSIIRYGAVVFPAFMILGALAERYRMVATAAVPVLLSAQVLVFLAWCRFYWAG